MRIANRLLLSCADAAEDMQRCRHRGLSRLVLGVEAPTLFIPERNRLPRPQRRRGFFDNVGGDTLSAVVENMAVHGRIALCGQIATYNEDGRTRAPLNVMKLVYWRVRIEGFIMSDWWDEMPGAIEELAGWIAEGRVKHREDIRTGFETVPQVFAELFAGTNEGTLLMKLADAEKTS